MGLAGKYFRVFLVFGTLQISIQTLYYDQNSIARKEDADIYYQSVQKLQELRRNFNSIVTKNINTQQDVKDIRTKVDSFATQTRIAVMKSLTLITSAASTVSQTCADVQSANKASIVNQTNQEIAKALRSLDQLKTVENDAFTINLRLSQNGVNRRVNQLLKCKENLIVTRVNVANITNCYKQIVKSFEDYIVSENNTVNALNKAVNDAVSRINLQQEFNNIIMNAIAIAKTNAQDIILCQVNLNKTEVYNVTAEIQKLIQNNQAAINVKSTKVMELINSIISRNKTIREDLDATVDGYLSSIASLFNSALNVCPGDKGNLSPDKLILPEVKTEIFKNIADSLKDIVGRNGTGAVIRQVGAVIKNLDNKITEKYVNERCQQYAGSKNYTSCAKDVLAELTNEVKNADTTLDNLYNQALQLNASFSAVLKIPLANTYNSTINQAVSTFTKSLGSCISAAYIDLGNNYNKLDNKLTTYKTTADQQIDKSYNKIKGAVDFARQLNLSISYEKVYPSLETLKNNVKQQIASIVVNTTEVGFNIDMKNNNRIDASSIETLLKNCTSQQNDFEKSVNNCIQPIIIDLNKELKIELSSVNKTSDRIGLFIEKLDKDVDKLVNKFIFQAYQVIKNASKEDKSSAVVETIGENVSTGRIDIQIDLDKIRTELDKVKLNTLTSIKETQNQIDKALGALNLAINVTLTYNAKFNLTQEKSILEKLIIDAKSNTNSTISNILNQYSANITDLTKQYLNLTGEYNKIISELNETTINNKCKNQSSDEKLFFNCIDSIIKQFNVKSFIIGEKIKYLLNTVNNLTATIDAIISVKITETLIPVKNVSEIVSTTIFTNYNVTAIQVLNSALIDIKQYNITDIREIVKQLVLNAKEIDDRAILAKREANYTLSSSGVPVYDTVGIGRILCSAKSVDELLKDMVDMISGVTKTVFAQSPDLSDESNSLLELAKSINSTLNYQLSLLDEDRLNVACPPSLADNGKLQNLYNCFVIEIQNFGTYYNSQTALLKTYKKKAFDKIISSIEDLKKWNVNFVVPQATVIASKAKAAAENFYKQCNITIEKVINYSINVARNHNNTFQARISSNFTAINILADIVASKNYSSPDIRSKLQSVVTPVDIAIAAVLNSKNKSIITEEIKRYSANLINDGIAAYNTYIANFSIQSIKYKQQIINLLQNRDELQKNYNYTYLYNTCYNERVPTSLIDLSACTNNLAYSNIFVVANTNILNSLLAIKLELQNWDANSVKLIEAFGELVANEQKKSGYYLAYKIYISVGLTVPSDVAAAVAENKCIRGIRLANSEFVCVITE